VYISKFSRSNRCTFLNLAEIPVDFCEEPTYHTYVPRVVRFDISFKPPQSRPGFLVQTQRPSASIGLLQNLGHVTVDAAEALERPNKTVMSANMAHVRQSCQEFGHDRLIDRGGGRLV